MNWFQLGPIPENAITGHYDYSLVGMSYIIAVLASYVALDLAGRLRTEPNAKMQKYWLLGGAFAMGAGIWSMHFIGMLAFIMPMPMKYELTWTIGSLIAAVLASALALYLVMNQSRKSIYIVVGGIFFGLGIATMHYMGMVAMTTHVNIRYLPSLFALSIVIAILASEVALWLALQSSTGILKRQFHLKIVSALIMGAAICGMHYVGILAAVFTPLPAHEIDAPTLNPLILAMLIAAFTVLIIGLALTVSIYYGKMTAGIQKEKDFLNVLLNNLEDGIIACDESGRISVCNKAIESICPCLKETSYLELVNSFKLMLPTIEKPIPVEQFPLSRAFAGEHIRGQEYIMVLTNEIKNVVIDGQPILDAEERKIGAVIAIHDITKLKETEKLKKEFISVVSHELRTPLTSIHGSLSLLLDEGDKDPSELKEFLQIAYKNTQRLIRLINDILDMEKIEAGKMHFTFNSLDITELVRSAVRELEGVALKAQVNIEIEYAAPEIVHGDYDRLMQVLVNLLSNAIRFSAPGQSVIIRITPFELTTRVSVIDQGPGIPVEFQKRIFQKFSQADNSMTRQKGGTGLGLSIAKAIIEKHGGTINFVTAQGRGTTFYFDLPKNAVEEKILPKPSDQLKPKIEVLANILICDSNPDSAAMLQKFFNQHHYHADIAYTARQAKELLKINTYQVIALDLILQDYDGVKFIRELRHRKATEDIPIIILTTRMSEDQQQLKGVAVPIIDWIRKPIREEDLNRLLDYISSHYTEFLPRILCVEDNVDISKIIEKLFAGSAQVYSAKTFEMAKKMLHTEPFDLIVLDLKLPDGIGTNLLPCINIDTRNVIPVVVFSAYELEQKYTHLVKASLLKSKVSNEQLVDVIQSVLKNTKSAIPSS